VPGSPAGPPRRGTVRKERSLKKVFTPLRVGLLTLAGLATFAYLFANVREGIDEGSGYTVYADFDDVSGLLNKSRVQVAGINVGQVESIELVGEKARVTLRVAVPLYRDAAVIKKQASMLGDYYLALVPGSQKPPLRDGDAIPRVVADAGVGAIFAELQTITEDIRAVTQSIRSVVGGPEGEAMLRTVAENLAGTTQAIRDSIERNQTAVDRTLANVERISADLATITGPGGRQVAQILAETGEIVHQINELVGTHKGEVGESVAELRQALQRLNENMTELQGGLEHMRSIADKVDRGEGTLGALVNDRRLHEDVSGVVRDVGGVLGSVAGLQTIVGLRSEYSLLGNSMKHYVSLRLQPKADKYYLLEVIDDPRGLTTVTQRTQRSSDPAQTPVVHEEVVETTDSLKISLELAKRYHFLTGRFGIIEGSGGVGVDLDLLDDNFTLQTDLFDFGLDLNPRLKFLATYQFFSHLYLAGGVDDALNGRGRDYFIGAAIRFSDDDLKGILTVAPMPSL